MRGNEALFCISKFTYTKRKSRSFLYVSTSSLFEAYTEMRRITLIEYCDVSVSKILNKEGVNEPGETEKMGIKMIKQSSE